MNTIIRGNNLSATSAYIDGVIICDRDQVKYNLKSLKGVARKYNLSLTEETCHYSLNEINYLGYTIVNGSLSPDSDRLKPLMNLPLSWDSVLLRHTLGLLFHHSQWSLNYSSQTLPLLECKSFPINRLTS